MKFSIASSFVVALMASGVAAAPMDTETKPPTVDYLSGFNLGANKADGGCKSTEDWAAEFSKIKSWSPEFTAVKLFSTADCSALANAVPAAIANGIKIWVGLWAIDRAKFDSEKGALEVAIKTHGSDWLLGINVGSESLYRKEIDPLALAGQIWDVKGMIQVAYGLSHIAVGSADTWTAWVDPANVEVIKACDVIVMNGFPYWQGARIDDAQKVFQQSVDATKGVIGGKQLIIGETGWPSAGPNFGDAYATVENLQKFYRSNGCVLRQAKTPHFWFSGFDEPNREKEIEKNFGIATADRNLKIDISC